MTRKRSALGSISAALWTETIPQNMFVIALSFLVAGKHIALEIAPHVMCRFHAVDLQRLVEVTIRVCAVILSLNTLIVAWAATTVLLALFATTHLELVLHVPPGNVAVQNQAMHTLIVILASQELARMVLAMLTLEIVSVAFLVPSTLNAPVVMEFVLLERTCTTVLRIVVQIEG